MRRALISDIHGNEHALDAVLADLQTQNIDEIFCLGDIVGYGASPVACVEKVKSTCNVVILGNHDYAALYDPENFNPIAQRSIFWTRDQLDGAENAEAIWEFLGELPKQKSIGDLLLVHGSPANPTREYLFPEVAYDARLMDRNFALVSRLCCCGHTHVPGVFLKEDQGGYEFISAELISEDGFEPDPGRKYIINVGSVGQPRDGDARSCYVVLDDERVYFRRVTYDVQAASDKIREFSALDPQCAERILTGR